jgi:diguanylate cyclase (GGDEF)-like protein
VVGILLGRQVSLPLAKLTKVVDKITSGDFSKRLKIKGPQEIRSLSQAFNRLTAELEENEHKQNILMQKLEELAISDDLTGLYNRRELNRLMEVEYKRAKRYNRPFSMIMLDIDHFKQYNDTFGHLFGDEVIKWVAHMIASNTRSTNYVARYGGDEFVILLPETMCSDAFWAADRLRKIVAETPFCGLDNNGQPIQISITVSLGVSELTNDIFSVGAFFSRTDQALYLSKLSGRDQTQLVIDKIKFIETHERVI